MEALQRELRQATKDLRSLEKAIAVLTGDAPATPKKPAAPDRPSDQAIARVLAVLAKQPGPISMTALAPQTGGIGKDTVRRALWWLREEGRVRHAGTTQGGGKLWAAMPEEARVSGDSRVMQAVNGAR